MPQLKDFTIQQKLFFPAVIISISFMVIASVYSSGYNQLQKVHANEEETQAFEVALLQFSADVSKAQNISNAFELRGESRFIHEHNDIIQQVYYALQNIALKATAVTIHNDLMQMKQQVKSYERTFLSLVEKRVQIGLSESEGLRGTMRKAVHHMEALVAEEHKTALTISILQMRRSEKDFIIRGTEKYINKLHTEQNQFVRLLDRTKLSATQKLALSTSIKAYREAFDDLAASTLAIQQLTLELQQYVDALTPILNQLSLNVLAHIEQQSAASNDVANSLSTTFYSALIFVALLVLISSTYITSSIITPLRHLLSRMQTIGSGKGDLSARLEIQGKDETAQLAIAMNNIMDMLSAMVLNIRQSSMQISGSSNQIASTMREQEATIGQQAATTHEIAASSKEIATTAVALQHNMESVVTQAQEAAQAAGTGQEQILLLEQALASMQAASGNISTKLGNLSEKAANISQVVTTITKVADQTNMLSLNASIEAEKAGEYGRGFAVVAQEIRHLADQTATASVDIENIIRDMLSSVSEGVMGMDKFGEEIRTGVATGTMVSEQLVAVIEQVQSLAPVVVSANDSLRDQAMGAEGISLSIAELQSAAQQTSDMVSRSGSAVEDLHDAAAHMQTLLSEFRVREDSSQA